MICNECHERTEDLRIHRDKTHVNIVRTVVWPGEHMTVRRRGGVFCCPWCCIKGSKLSDTRLRSAWEMKVGACATAYLSSTVTSCLGPPEALRSTEATRCHSQADTARGPELRTLSRPRAEEKEEGVQASGFGESTSLRIHTSSTGKRGIFLNRNHPVASDRGRMCRKGRYPLLSYPEIAPRQDRRGNRRVWG